MAQTKKQREAFKIANIAGIFAHIAETRGAKGFDRKPLTAKEAARRKKRRQMAKASRKRNQAGGR